MSSPPELLTMASTPLGAGERSRDLARGARCVPFRGGPVTVVLIAVLIGPRAVWSFEEVGVPFVAGTG
ncbi:MAG: hypothetical protein ACREEC_04215 [Thermoplasmata archaeon]